MPTEGLLVPSVFLGVLRAFASNNGCSTSADALLDALRKVQDETKTDVDLVRSPERNLVRNSGQYWKGMGLIKDTRGVVELSALGQKVAESELSQDDFAALIIQQTTLPNKAALPEELFQQWVNAGLRFKPFVLILQIMVMMGNKYGHSEAYLTENELTKIVVPLSGAKTELQDYLSYINAFREKNLDLSGWPNCIPEDNDRRMAREFLYFLRNFGVCTESKEDEIGNNKFRLVEMLPIDEVSALDVPTENTSLGTDEEAEASLILTTQSILPGFIERQRTVASIILRPEQGQFRKLVLEKFQETCLVTGDNVPKVLEAAHIIPVNMGGSDELDNGLCLRSDIHRLYDSQLLRIKPDGRIAVSSKVKKSPGYANLPPAISVPSHVNSSNIEWRNNYC